MNHTLCFVSCFFPGLLVPDLPLEETSAIRAACERAGLELVLLCTPTTPQARMADIAKASQGFVYLVSVTGEHPGSPSHGTLVILVLVYLPKVHWNCLLVPTKQDPTTPQRGSAVSF